MSDDILKRFQDEAPDPVGDELIGELEPPRLPPPDLEDPRWRFGRIAVAVAATGALAVGVLVFALLASGGGGESAGPLPPIPKPLATASAAAAESEPTGIQYTRTTQLTLAISGNYSFYQPHVYEAWVRPDGSGYLRTIERPAEWPGPRDEERAIKADDQDAIDRTNEPPKVLQDGELSADQIDESWSGGGAPAAQSLSSDPSELRDQLESFGSGAGPINVRAFQRAASVLLNPETDGSVRAAAFEVIGQLGGVTIDKSATDPEGRETTSASISYDYSGPPGSTMTVYFDPESSRAFAFTDILDAPARFIDSRTLTSIVLTDAKTVSSIP
jgi:hypothetical protein